MSCAYIIESETGLWLVDAGLPNDDRKILDRMKEMGRDDLRLIYITHAHLDHYGGAAALRRKTGAPIAIHRDDAQAMSRGETALGSARGRGRLVQAMLPLAQRLWNLEPTEPDLVLDDGASLEAFGIDGRLVHTPGHTPGSSCLMVDGRVAFAGDLISTTGQPHVQRFFAHDWALLSQSMVRLQRMNPVKIYPGHGARPMNGRSLQSLRWRETG